MYINMEIIQKIVLKRRVSLVKLMRRPYSMKNILNTLRKMFIACTKKECHSSTSFCSLTMFQSFSLFGHGKTGCIKLEALCLCLEGKHCCNHGPGCSVLETWWKCGVNYTNVIKWKKARANLQWRSQLQGKCHHLLLIIKGRPGGRIEWECSTFLEGSFYACQKKCPSNQMG